MPSPSSPSPPALSATLAWKITAGPDGNLWFTSQRQPYIGMINPTTDAISEFATPTCYRLVGITAGPDGNLWFTEDPAEIGLINPTTDAITEYPVPTPASGDHDGPRRQPLVHRPAATRSASPP